MKTTRLSIRLAAHWLSFIVAPAVLLSAAGAQTGPSITQQPASQTNLARTIVTLSVAVSGTGPFTYQWRFNGTNLPSNIITTAAGNGSAPSFGHSGDGGQPTNASLDPFGVALDTSGNLFIAERSSGFDRIRKVDAKGVITTVAGTGSSTFSGDGGPATNAGFEPTVFAVDSSGNVFIADYANYRVRKVDGKGIITTVAGNGSFNYSGDGGAATNAGLEAPSGVALDAMGNLLIPAGLSRLRKVDTNGIINTVAGSKTVGFSGDGGPATNASLSFPTGVAVDRFGNLFIADHLNNRIRKVDVNGVITTAAGNGTSGYSGDGGPATNAILSSPEYPAVDASGNLFFADRGNARIRKVDINGFITTVAGNGTLAYSGDGGAATNASLADPAGVGVDASDTLFIPEANRVRKVSLHDLPVLTLNNFTNSTAGNYQVVITSPYGSVTSVVARLTVGTPPVQKTIIDMGVPVVSGNKLLLGFTLTQGSSASFTLLQASRITGPWTTNTVAVLTTNTPAVSYQFSVPLPGSIEFFRVRSP